MKIRPVVPISENQPNLSARIYSVDILRGLMAMAVVCYHASLWYGLFEPGTRSAMTLAKMGVYGVQGFFIISGFCFFHLYGRRIFDGPALKSFFLKRWLRLAPLYFVVVILNLTFGLKAGPDPSIRMLVENGTLSFGFFHPNHALVVGGWSIGVEVVFYAALPGLVLFVRRSRAWLYVFALLLIYASTFYTMHWIQEAKAWNRFHVYVQVFNHAFLFLLGGIIAHLRSLTAFRLKPWICGAFLALIALFILRINTVFYDHFDIMTGLARYQYTGLCAAAVLCFAFWDAKVSRATKPLLALGDLSYGTYLLHPPAYALMLACGRGAAGWTNFFACLLLTLFFAWCAHRFIEKPAMGLGRS